ncbi:MAG: penicillin-binding protein 2 [Candidatus Gastranaerophilales bacterium]|nr:penicillin-binding protein 2 [Candidatus Gastranaerophilales bacterium]
MWATLDYVCATLFAGDNYMKRKIAEDKTKEIESRIKIAHIFILVMFCVSIIYLFLLQIADIRHYKQRAQSQRLSKNFIMRGQIVDRNGLRLATDQTSYNLYAHREYFDHTPEELAEKLSPYLDMDKSSIVQNIKKGATVILLKKDVDRETGEKIKKLGLRELSLDKKNERVYPQDELAAHIIGYYNPDADTASGVELSAKQKLQAANEDITVQRTPRGDIIFDKTIDPVLASTPQVGQTVTLTIDSAIQHVCERELLNIINEKKAARGAVIVMNPKNGEILGYAVYPRYNPNNYKKTDALTLKNWTLTDVYPPGSTFKTLTVAAGIESGKINAASKVLDTGKMQLGNWTVQNYDYNKNPNPGMISLVYLFEHSSNVGSANIALMMSPVEFYSILSNFGIGKKSGIDLAGESTGLLPKPFQWDKSRQATMGYGYGASVTAMQMVSAVSALANDGVRVTPHVIKYSPEEEAEKVKRVQAVSPETAKLVTMLLAQSVENSRSVIKLDRYTVAGKTGTSKKPKEKSKGYSNALYASVIGYLPAKDPKMLVYVVVDSASAGGPVYGNTVAGPVFKEVANQCARILNIPPDKNVVE